MTHPDHMHERRYRAEADRLRSPERLTLLEVPRVVQLCTEGIDAVSVLDVGTGTGIFAEAFAVAPAGTSPAGRAGVVRRVTGIDPNADLMARARALAPGVDFLEGTAERLPFADKSFDLVFLGHVLHETDDRAAALSEARRVAKLRVAVLEWPWKDEERGPPLAHRLEPSTILGLGREAGFTSVDRVTLSHMELFRLSP